MITIRVFQPSEHHVNGIRTAEISSDRFRDFIIQPADEGYTNSLENLDESDLKIIGLILDGSFVTAAEKTTTAYELQLIAKHRVAIKHH